MKLYSQHTFLAEQAINKKVRNANLRIKTLTLFQAAFLLHLFDKIIL